jgi:hypothetical protein
MIDLNEGEEQREAGAGGAIPEDSIVPFKMTIRPPKAGKEGTQHPLFSKSGKGNEYIDVEFEALGSMGGRKIWQMFTLHGSDQARQISMRTLRAIVESGRGISPKDVSPAASAGRQLSDWADFNEINFLMKVGVAVEQNTSNGNWYVNNTIKHIVTPDDEAYLAGEHITDKPLPAVPAAGEPAKQQTTGPAPTGPAHGTTAAPAKPAASGSPTPAWAKR